MSSQRPALQVSDIGSFYVGGETQTLSGLPLRLRVSTPGGPVHHIDPNGEIAVGQMYVQYVRLAKPTFSVPLLLWHGGGMSGVNWETTPDGRAGWQMFFLRAGFDVYVSDAVERGRSSWAPYPEIYDSAPYFRTAREAWEDTFRFGQAGSWHREPDKRQPYVDTRFPVQHMETFMKQFIPRWDNNDIRTQSAYDKLIDQMGETVLITHSQGGNFGLTAAVHAPDKIKAVISLEPSGAPDPSMHSAGILRHVPHLFVWGDNLDNNQFWQHSMPNVKRWHEALCIAGGDSEWVSLTAQGITGNTHALMADNNSDYIAELVLNWLKRKGI